MLSGNGRARIGVGAEEAVKCSVIGTGDVYMVVNAALAAGALDRSLLLVKQHAVELLSADYPDSATARAQIAEEVERRFPITEGGAVTAAQIEQTVAILIELYQLDHFPELGVDWTDYPSHIGHRTSPGCFRCHEGEHSTSSGETISANCFRCHSVSAMADTNPEILTSLGLRRPIEQMRKK